MELTLKELREQTQMVLGITEMPDTVVLSEPYFRSVLELINRVEGCDSRARRDLMRIGN